MAGAENSLQWWLTLFGIIVPLVTLAGSAVAYVVTLFQDASSKRRERFFELMHYLDGPSTIASKMAAVYQLREFPEHGDFIVRFCEAQQTNVTGAAAPLLVQEFEATRAFMSERQ
jgi:hypothetical protein